MIIPPILIKTLRDTARVPTYASHGAACFDFFACDQDCVVTILEPGQQRTIGTGLCFEIPHGFVMLIYSRSGHGFKNGVRLANCVGVIDSDYRGEVQVALRNDGSEVFHVSRGDRIAQGMIVPAPQTTFTVVQTLTDTARGTGGFGSTGA